MNKIIFSISFLLSCSLVFSNNCDLKHYLEAQVNYINETLHLTKEAKYATKRTLGDYGKIFGTTFVESLEKMSAGETWLDGGAGDALAIGEALKNNFKGNAVGVGVQIFDSGKENIAELHQKFGKNFRYIEGFWKDISREKIPGKIKLITDYFGVFSYDIEVDLALQKYFDVLEKEGTIDFVVALPNIQIRYPTDPTRYATDPIRPHGPRMFQLDLSWKAKASENFRHWLDNIEGASVEQFESVSDPDIDLRVRLTKRVDQVNVPRFKGVERFEKGTPPVRGYLW